MDISHEKHEEQIEVVNKTLQELGASDKPMITVFNKMDLYTEKNFDEWLPEDVKTQILEELSQKWHNIPEGNRLFIAAAQKQNIETLRDFLLTRVRELYSIRYPYKVQYY